MERLTLASEDALRLCGFLLRDPNWRQRVVEQIQPVSSDHYHVARSYQFELTPDLVRKADLSSVQTVSGAIVPIGWFEKTPLLDLDIVDRTGSSLMMLERRSIAGILSNVLDEWQKECDIDAATLFGGEEFEALSVASLAMWTMFEQSSRDRLETAANYVYAGTGHRLSRAWLAHSLDMAEQIANSAYDVLGQRLYAVRPEPDNTALNTVLLAPHLDPIPATGVQLRTKLSSIQRRMGRLI